MSQIENKVEWCLNKAKNEGIMHRGLKKIEPNKADAIKHIKKAEHNFNAILDFKKIGYPDWSVSASFYTIYQCFLAILAKFGYESKNQECTIALILQLSQQGKIDLSKDILESLQRIEPDSLHETNVIIMRENFQYGMETTIEDNKLEELFILSKKTIEETKSIIYNES
jgi:uncharacterized protein (UPF0332 family)